MTSGVAADLHTICHFKNHWCSVQCPFRDQQLISKVPRLTWRGEASSPSLCQWFSCAAGQQMGDSSSWWLCGTVTPLSQTNPEFEKKKCYSREVTCSRSDIQHACLKFWFISRVGCMCEHSSAVFSHTTCYVHTGTDTLTQTDKHTHSQTLFLAVPPQALWISLRWRDCAEELLLT